MRDLVFSTPEYDALRCRSAVTFITILFRWDFESLPVTWAIASFSLLICEMSSRNGGQSLIVSSVTTGMADAITELQFGGCVRNSI